MKKLVIFKSKTGFTETYARWIGKALDCDVIQLNKVDNKIIKNYDVIIYGGWIMGNVIRGFNKIKKYDIERLIVYGVGSLPNELADEDSIIESNSLVDIPFFYMSGGFRVEGHNFFIRKMLEALKKSINKNTEKNPRDVYMSKNLGTNFNNMDDKNINPLVKYVKGDLNV